MLFCPSFTQSERFLQTDQLITRLQVAVMTNFIRMLMRNVIVNVFKSDAVIWWAAIFRTPSSMFDKLLHLSKSQGSVMSRSRSHNLREANSDLLTVTMYLQNSLSRFHRPPTIMLHAGLPIKYLSKRLMLISSRVVVVPT